MRYIKLYEEFTGSQEEPKTETFKFEQFEAEEKEQVSKPEEITSEG